MTLRSKEAASSMDGRWRSVLGALGVRYCFSDGSSKGGGGVHATSARYAWEQNMSMHVAVGSHIREHEWIRILAL